MINHKELDLEHLQAKLRTSAIGHTFDYYRTVDSTMPLAQILGEDPSVRSGHVIVAEEQSAGKGRRGRMWSTPYAQALLVSVVLKPPKMPVSQSQIPMAAGLAVADALLTAVPDLSDAVNLKWPNDVLLGYGIQAGKVAGILAESAFDEVNPVYSVIGIGINVNQDASELPEIGDRMQRPVSVCSHLGEVVDRTGLLVELCQQLAAYLDPQLPPDAILSEWRSRLSTLGQRVAVFLHPESNVPKITGLALDVTSSGDLLVENADGRIHSFSAADVSVRAAQV